MTTFGNVLRGVAYGDSWGEPNEFQSIRGLTKDSPKGPGMPKELRISDDTQMTLYLATALKVSAGMPMPVVKTAIEAAFLRYYDDPMNNRAPGMTVMGSLAQLKRGAPWQAATNKGSDGCGTVMRTSPCAFLPEDQWVGVTAFAAALTHGAANAIAAAILNVALLRGLLAGEIRFGELIEAGLELASNPHRYGFIDVGEDEWLDGYEVPGGLASGFEELAQMLALASAELPTLRREPWALEADPSFQQSTRQSPSRGGGWRAHTCLGSALLAIDMLADTDPVAALRRAVTTDGDSDSIGAVAGALLGAGGVDWVLLGEDGQDVFTRLEPVYQEWITEASDYFTEEVSA